MKKKLGEISGDAVSQFVEIVQLIRQHRKSFKTTANATAETAGTSRETLHRIEKSEPIVCIGA
jgi:DNA-binding XRE family transcriptional regulator